MCFVLVIVAHSFYEWNQSREQNYKLPIENPPKRISFEE